MLTEIAHLIEARKNCLRVIEGISFEDICKIPKGFNNSILWNVGHLVVTQQVLAYKSSGLPMNVDEEIIEGFKKGSVPNAAYTKSQWQKILDLFIALPLQLNEDYKKGKFKSYEAYPTSFGITLSNIDEAIKFNNIHEGLHIGYIMALKRVV